MEIVILVQLVSLVFQNKAGQCPTLLGWQPKRRLCLFGWEGTEGGKAVRKDCVGRRTARQCKDTTGRHVFVGSGG